MISLIKRYPDAYSSQNYFATIKLLIEFGTDTRLQDNLGKTFWDYIRDFTNARIKNNEINASCMEDFNEEVIKFQHEGHGCYQEYISIFNNFKLRIKNNNLLNYIPVDPICNIVVDYL